MSEIHIKCPYCGGQNTHMEGDYLICEDADCNCVTDTRDQQLKALALENERLKKAMAEADKILEGHVFNCRCEGACPLSGVKREIRRAQSVLKGESQS